MVIRRACSSLPLPTYRVVSGRASDTGEISRTAQEAAIGTQQVNIDIAGISEASAQIGKSASEVLKSAQELSQQSETLRTEVDNFLAGVSAA